MNIMNRHKYINLAILFLFFSYFLSKKLLELPAVSTKYKYKNIQKFLKFFNSSNFEKFFMKF